MSHINAYCIKVSSKQKVGIIKLQWYFTLKLFLASPLLTVKVQQPAPDFQGIAVVGNDFQEMKLSDFAGKYLVLFFYPLDL